MISFDFIAPFYDVLSVLVYGRSIRKAQTYFLNEIKGGSKVLILGGGVGWILNELGSIRTDVEVDYVEVSSKMLSLSKAHLKYEFEKLNFIHGTEKELVHGDYDFVLTPFVLDVFPYKEMVEMVFNVGALLKGKGDWVCVDFNSKDHSFKAKLLSFIMIHFFRIVSGLKITRVLDYFGEIERLGLESVEEKCFYGSFIKAQKFSKR